MRTKLIRLFSLLAVLSCIGLLLYPIIGDFVASFYRKEATVQYDDSMKQVSEQDVEAQLQEANLFNENLYRQQIGETPQPGAKDYDKIINYSGVMATLEVPAIGIREMPIYHGSDMEVLDHGIGHIPRTSIPVGGKNTHSVITGHSGVQNQILFSNVNSLKKGDVFYIHVLKKTLAYQVYHIERVFPNEVDAIKIQPGEDLATLLTCDPPGINTYRLLVTGKQIPYEEARKQPVIKRNLWDYTHKVILGLGLFLLLLALRGLYLVVRQKREKKTQARRKEDKLRLIEAYYNKEEAHE